jgi:hypothetical protein
MTRAITDRMFGPNNAFWDFVYQAVVIGLAVASTTAIYLQISSL